MTRIKNPASPLPAQLQGFHLFHFDGAPCAQRVRFALGEKGLKRGRDVHFSSVQELGAPEGTWTSRLVSLIRKDHMTEEYSAIHPNMVVPALVHNGELHIESVDIIRYLDDLFPQTPLIPRDPQTEETVMDWVKRGKALHRSVRFVSFRWGLGRLAKLNKKEEEHLSQLERSDSPEHLTEFYTHYSNGKIPEETFIKHLRDLESAWAELDRLLEDERPFLTGQTFTLADILWSIKVLRIQECGYPFKTKFPALFEWFQRVRQREAFKESVMGKHKAMHVAFRVKSSIERLAGRGIDRVAA